MAAAYFKGDFMRRRWLPAFATALLFVCILAPANKVSAQGSEPRNLSFEEPVPVDGFPPGWWFIQHAGPPSFEFAIDDDTAHTGGDDGLEVGGIAQMPVLAEYRHHAAQPLGPIARPERAAFEGGAEDDDFKCVREHAA